MKAVRLKSVGGLEVLQYTEVEEPKPRANEVLIQVAAAGVNFMDIGARRGMVGGNYKPEILGVEGAGRIIELGEGVVDFGIGDRVAWVFVQHSYAERVVAPVQALVKLPDELDERIAASIMMQGLTASHFANEFYPVQPGDVALVHAAAGGLGQILTQIIRNRGGTVIGRVSHPDKVEVAKGAGANHVIVDAEGKFADDAIRFSGGEGAHVVYDGSGPTTFAGSLAALRPAGTLCWYGPVLGGPGPIDIMSLPKSIKIGYAVFSDHIRTLALFQARANDLFADVAAGKLKILPPRAYPLADVSHAHADMEGRRSTGKLLLIP